MLQDRDVQTSSSQDTSYRKQSRPTTVLVWSNLGVNICLRKSSLLVHQVVLAPGPKGVKCM